MPDLFSETKKYVEARNEALTTLPGFMVWVERMGMAHPDPHVTEITFHKLRTASVTLPMELRSASKKWLTERGMESIDDGDVP